ncbi:MAG: hypothetical protein Q8847_02715, partial [Sweet potato little leaf phytoplasma]|nr:hypothetical protein [Sweet potato little leaf phytoplasma]
LLGENIPFLESYFHLWEPNRGEIGDHQRDHRLQVVQGISLFLFYLVVMDMFTQIVTCISMHLMN